MRLFRALLARGRICRETLTPSSLTAPGLPWGGILRLIPVPPREAPQRTDPGGALPFHRGSDAAVGGFIFFRSKPPESPGWGSEHKVPFSRFRWWEMQMQPDR